MGAVNEADRSSTLFMLRGRGFPVSENQFRLFDVLGDTEGVGPLTIREGLRRVYENAYASALEARSRGEEESPRAKRITQIATESKALLELPLLKDERRLEQEAHLHQMLSHLADTRDLLEDLELAVQDARQAWDRGESFGNFDMVFRVMGHPLLPADWERVNVNTLTGPFAQKAPKDARFTKLNAKSFNRYFSRLMTNWTEGVVRVPGPEHNDVEQRIREFGSILYSILEDALNLYPLFEYTGREEVASEADTSVRIVAPPRQRTTEAARPGDRELYLRRAGSVDDARKSTVIGALIQMKLNLNKANYLISQVMAGTHQQLRRDKNMELSQLRIQTERFAEDLADLTQRRAFRKLRRAPEGKPPTYVTFILKTLYLRHLGYGDQQRPHSKNNELLVTCGIKHEQNAEQTVYPVIFEQDFSPGFAVNRLDRILYGPAAYFGKMFDVRFTVLELDDLNNKALTSGFASLTAAIGTFNPEFGALAPALNKFMESIVNVATENDKEMDFSFTIPQPEGEGMADTDFLVAETGHYIIIKTENPNRSSVSAAAARRQLYRRLIYNPNDSLLYHRRFFNDPKANFTPDNLFLSQNYAVIVVTDEYTQPDNLGDMLRKQVQRTLDEARARELVPDAAQTRQFIDTYKTLTGATNAPMPIDGAAFKKVATALKDELWQPIPEMRQQLIAETLYQRADPTARLAIGSDPSKWKTARIVVDEHGIVHLGAEPLPPIYCPLPRRTNTLCAFSELPVVTNLDFVLMDALGNVSSNLANFGSVDAAGCYQPVAFNETDRLLSVPSLKVLARQKGSSVVLHEREIIFSGDFFGVTGTIAVGNTTNSLSTEAIQPGIYTNNNYTITVEPKGEGYKTFEIQTTPNLRTERSDTRYTFTLPASLLATNHSVSVKLYPTLFKRLVEAGTDRHIPIKTMQWPIVER